LYVAAFGSSKIGVFATEAIEQDRFDPTRGSQNYLSVTGGGPAGVTLDEARGRLYVSTRFDDGLSVIDLATGRETSHLILHDPEPARVKAGRPFLYDAQKTSSNGEASCASCHLFGDNDHLAWDLGNPDGELVRSPITVKLGQAAPDSINGGAGPSNLHPMKGPMSTQTLRGTANHGAMHWRADRALGLLGNEPRATPPFDSKLSFENFIVAFNALLGLVPEFSPDDMQTFSDFALAVVMPPNPVRSLDNSLDAAEAAGRSFFMGCAGRDSLTGNAASCDDRGLPRGAGHFADGSPAPGSGFTCQGCHRIDPAAGFFGTDGQASFESFPQTFKIPQLRNLYDKVGMFGIPAHPGMNLGDNGPTGEQVRGFGYLHDGSVDTLFRFLQHEVFNPASEGLVGFDGGDAQRREVERFLLAFDNDLAPIVGQQVTLRTDNASAVGPRIDLLMARARAPFVSKILGSTKTECELVARFVLNGVASSYRMQSDQSFRSPIGNLLSDGELRELARTPGQEVTYTCLPPGW
jgi:hypothetical protein